MQYDPRHEPTVANRSGVKLSLPIAWQEWQLLRMIGRGSFGDVYEAYRNNGTLVDYCAIKHIPVPRSANEIAEDRRQGYFTSDTGAKQYYRSAMSSIVKEIKIMKGFSGHSHIVSYLDYAIVERPVLPGYDVFIRMERLESLNAYLTTIESACREQTVATLGVDICDALEALHAGKIIHRDIKPANILYGKFGFKLADFGVARSLEATGSVTLAGTLDYMAPEIYQHRKDVNYTSDLYSLAIVMYRLLNGNRMPFLPNDPAVVIDNTMSTEAFERRMQGEPLPRIDGVSEPLMDVICKAGSFAVEDRYASAHAMCEALQCRQTEREPQPANGRVYPVPMPEPEATPEQMPKYQPQVVVLTPKQQMWQMSKFILFSTSAGLIQIGSFTLFNEVLHFTYWLSYGLALVLSVLWNFTLNRRYTFRSDASIPKAMGLVFLFYVVFTPLSSWCDDALTAAGWNEYSVLVDTMLVNSVTEYLYQRFVVYRHSIDTRKALPKSDVSPKPMLQEATSTADFYEEADIPCDPKKHVKIKIIAALLSAIVVLWVPGLGIYIAVATFLLLIVVYVIARRVSDI